MFFVRDTLVHFKSQHCNVKSVFNLSKKYYSFKTKLRLLRVNVTKDSKSCSLHPLVREKLYDNAQCYLRLSYVCNECVP